MNFESLLKFAVEQGASDIHLQAGQSPMLRLHGQMRSVEGSTVTEELLRRFLEAIVPEPLRKDLDRAARRGAVFLHDVPELARFRGSLYRHSGGSGVSLRVIPRTIPALEEMHLPATIADVALARRGLTLIVGGSGSGRSTTLAILLDLINKSIPSKVITIEDPIEFVLQGDRALIAQWQVGRDTPSIRQGLRSALRQDPDAIVIGRLEGSRLVQAALVAVESGRRVIAVMDGSTTVQTIERILALVPPNERMATSVQLAHSLEAIIAQRMAVTREGRRRPVIEILRGSPLVTRALLENRMNDLRMVLGGHQGGMQTFDQHLVELYQGGVISGTEAMRLSTNPEAVAADLRTKR